MREELHMALLSQQPPTFPPDLIQIDRGFGSTDDDTWAIRIILLCREILSFVLSESEDAEMWPRFASYVEEWSRTRPDSFNPIIYKPALPESGNPLPEIWFLHEAQSS